MAAVGRRRITGSRDESVPDTPVGFRIFATPDVGVQVAADHRRDDVSSRFQIRTSPLPSQTRSFTRSAPLQRNTKIVPENGSCRSTVCTTAARPSAPRRPGQNLDPAKAVPINWQITWTTIHTRLPSRRRHHLKAAAGNNVGPKHHLRLIVRKANEFKKPGSGWRQLISVPVMAYTVLSVSYSE